MGGDLQTIGSWWLILFLFGLAGWPLGSIIFPKWEDRGYLMAKTVGILATAYLVWGWGSLQFLEYGRGSIAGAMGLIFLGGLGIRHWTRAKKLKINWRLILAEEFLFLTALTGWAWVKAHEPTINGLEKFMDYGFARSIQRTSYFPPADMWFAGETINYYYFGHLVMAMISDISGVELEAGFNLMLATLLALCLTMSFSVGRELLEKYPNGVKLTGALFIALLVTFSGNLHTIYAFTPGYWEREDNPPPFWEAWQPIESKSDLLSNFDNYWYPNATRFIPYTIHEFPMYSFVVSDIHGHVLSIPIVLLLIGLLVQFYHKLPRGSFWLAGVYGVTAGTAFMTNALDGPIYIGLFGLLHIARSLKFSISNYKSMLKTDKIKEVLAPLLIAGVSFTVSVLPFLMSFKPFVNGIAVNCPPAVLANRQIGPLIFEEADKCQKSPLWMMLVLWGFFLYSGVGLWLLTRDDTEHKRQMLLWAVTSLLLIMFAEFFYFKDIYPQHFRSNTMFKLGYQAFILMSIVSGFTIVTLAVSKYKNTVTKVFLSATVPLLFLIMIYPYFAVRSYFNGLKNYQGLNGLNWMREKYPETFEAVKWINEHIPGQPVILEAAGDSYSDYNLISSFTGLPTVAGWAVHEWLWRGGYEPVGKRSTEVSVIYEPGHLETARVLLEKYQVKYIITGVMEKKRYSNLSEEKIRQLGDEVFAYGGTKIFRVKD